MENKIERERTLAKALLSFPFRNEWFENLVRGMQVEAWHWAICGSSGGHVRESDEHARV